MARLDIKTFPDPVLQKKAEPVEAFDEELEKLSQDMLETMHAANGIGLAAPQVGILKQLLVIEIPDDEEEAGEQIVICNPTIAKREGSAQIEEGCLSLPNFFLEVERAQRVTVEGQDVHGEDMTIEADGLLSICLQHEIDHLHGKLLVNYVSPIKRKLYQKEMKKWSEENKYGEACGPRNL